MAKGELSHLHSTTREMALLDDNTRVLALQRERWIDYPRASAKCGSRPNRPSSTSRLPEPSWASRMKKDSNQSRRVTGRQLLHTVGLYLLPALTPPWCLLCIASLSASPMATRRRSAASRPMPDAGRVRLAEIDTPQKRQRFGKRTREWLPHVVPGCGRRSSRQPTAAAIRSCTA